MTRVRSPGDRRPSALPFGGVTQNRYDFCIAARLRLTFYEDEAWKKTAFEPGGGSHEP